ncbi:MAG: ParA family protein [Candidatus Bathyarchaeota archaeon]|nr:ParA family protein [Candidatus Bathyarchaeota archaeon]
MGNIIALHSYKGGTGKTHISINLAVSFAKHGKKVCLMDLDFRAPSLATFFSHEKVECWLNDYLNGACKIDKTLIDISHKINGEGKLFVVLANPSTEAIREMSAKDRKWEMRALGRLLALRNSLLNDKGFDYLIFDTSPGLQYSSINAIVSADLVIVAATFDRSDVEGTKRMLDELYDLFEKKTEIVMNRVLYDVSSKSGKNSLEKKIEDIYQTPVLGMIPCFCDVAKAEGAIIFVQEKPEHLFSKIMDEMSNKIERSNSV